MARTNNNGSTKKTCGVTFDSASDKAAKSMHGATTRAAFDLLTKSNTVSDLLAGAWGSELFVDLQRCKQGSESKVQTIVILDGEAMALWVACTIHTGHTGSERMVRVIAKVQRQNGDVVNLTPKATPAVRSCKCAYQMRGEANVASLSLADLTSAIALTYQQVADEARAAGTLAAFDGAMANLDYAQNFVRTATGELARNVKGRIVRK